MVSNTLKLLNEALNLVVTLSLENNSTVRGRLAEIDDHMNVLIEDAEILTLQNEVSNESTVFIRGSTINFFVLPPALKFAPFLFNKAQKEQ